MADARVIPIHQPDPSSRCAARNADGRQCRNRAADGGYCARHAALRPAPEQQQAAPPPPSQLQERIAEVLAFMRRRLTGEYSIDDMGFDQDLTENVVVPLLEPLYKSWWRVQQIGVSNIPVAGPALLVSNHSGTLPFDALMMKMGVYEELGRHVRLLAADLALTVPVVGEMARKSGNTLACEEDAMRLLRTDELVGVFPEGFKGIGKPFRERYRLQRFGRGGFVEVALRAGVPIVPVAIVGAEEIYPLLGNLKPLARLFGVPYFPVTPTFPLLGPLGMIPLPSKWIIEYAEPIDTAGFGAESANDPMFVFNLTDQVREVIQQTLFKNLMQRRNAFL